MSAARRVGAALVLALVLVGCGSTSTAKKDPGPTRTCPGCGYEVMDPNVRECPQCATPLEK